MSLSRRDFLGAVTAGGTVLALPRWLRADDTKAGGRAPAPPRRTVILIHLNGGNDGLNTVIPYKDRRYPSLRPGLAIPGSQVRKLSNDLGLHPGLQGFERLFQRDRLAIVNGVGYPQPNYSHFRSTEIWYTAEPDATPTDGWMGRAIETRPSDRPVRAVALSKEQPLSLVTSVPGVVTMTDFGRFRVPSGLDAVTQLYRDYAKLDGARGGMGQAGEEAIDVARRISRLKPASGQFYSAFGEDLRKAIALLEAGLDLECIQLSQGGYDTHANQAASHQRLLSALGNNLDSFQRELERRKLADKVVTVVFSEFGRRASENLSGGTDHGSAGPVFVIGKGVNNGFHGKQPSLDDLDRDNLKFTTDFRSLYAALIQHAYEIDPKPLIGDYAPLELFA
jgi:uncharacterized protein (DUF1501 family)